MDPPNPQDWAENLEEGGALMIRQRVLRLFVFPVAALILVVSGLSGPLTAAAQEESFFDGKTIRIITGFSPGGGTDLRARIFARHLAKHIPGDPTIIVQIMTGAGGLVAANYTLGGVAKPDGLSIIHFPSSTVMNVFLVKGKVKYDIRKTPILWVQSDLWVTISNPQTSGLKTADDLAHSNRQIAIGGSGVSSLRTLRPKLALDLLGVDNKWVTGYRGSAGLMAALDRGEIHVAEEAMGSSYAKLIQPREQDGTLTILFQTGILKPDGSFERSPVAPDTPTLAELLPEDKKSGAAWDAWKAAILPAQAFQNVVALPAGVPPERLAILQRAFAEVTDDPAFRADYEKTLDTDVRAITGEEAASVVDGALAQLFEKYQDGVEYLRQMPRQN